jgi:hypothetical protein
VAGAPVRLSSLGATRRGPCSRPAGWPVRGCRWSSHRS